MIRRVAGLALLLLPAACRTSEGRVQHVVLLWLNEPDNAAHVQRVVDASLGLGDVPGVLEVVVGPALPSERDVVDDSFTVGIVFTLEDEASLARYLDHPLHVQAKEEVLAPLVERIQVYDLTRAGAR